MFGNENLPYTNFHDLNLDWIIKTMKELAQKNEDLDYIAEQAEEIKQRLEELNDLDEEFQEVKEDFLDLVADFATLSGEVQTLRDDVDYELATIRKPLTDIICLTDSYGSNDDTADRYSWCDQLREMAGLDSAHYTKLYRAGGSFGDPDTTKNLYNVFVDGTTNMTTERKESVSDIIIVSGINEWDESRTNMTTNINSLDTYIRSNFPNAHVWLFAVQWDKVAAIRFATMGKQTNTYRDYQNLARSNGWHFVRDISAMVYSNVYVDDVHPNSAGSRMIASIIFNSMQGNSSPFNTGYMSAVTITTSTGTRNAGGIWFNGEAFVWSSNTFATDALPDLPGTFVGEVLLGTLNTNAIIGGDYANIPYPINTPCKLIAYNGTWHNLEGTMSLRYNVSTKKADVYFRNNGQLPAEAITNITESYIYFGATTIPVWD